MCITFGGYEEKDITEQGDIYCKDIFAAYHDYDTDFINWDEEDGFFELDEIESISVEEYNIAYAKSELAKVLEKEIFKTLK